MKSINIKEFGSLDNLVFGSYHEPILGEEEVLIEVYCAGVSFADILVVEGKYQDTPELPFVPGLEVSGMIKKIGNNVKHLKIGDEVVALTKWGGFSELVCVNTSFVYKKSDNMDFDVAACMTINYGTSYHALVERARIKKDDKILILGASGGIGLSAIEIAKAVGSNVTAAASSELKLSVCAEYGADNLILTTNDNIKDSLKDSKERKFDIIYDTLGGNYSEDSLSFISWEGQLLIVGFATGKIPKINSNKLLLKGCSALGIFWGPFARGNTNFNLSCIKELNKLYDEKKIKLVSPKLFHMEEFKEAFLEIKNRKSIGKICLYTDLFSKGR